MGVVMRPDGSDFEVEGVLNPGVTRDRENNLLLFPRMVAAGNVSRIGLARVGKDAEVERLGVLLEAETDYERRGIAGGHGCEDARVTFIGELGAYVMTYTAFGPAGARIAIAVSSDAYTWTRLGLVHFPEQHLNAVDNKDAAFFPEAVQSPAGVPSFAFFHRPMRDETINGQTPIPVILALSPQLREAACIAYVPVADAKRDLRCLCEPVESVRVLEVGETWGKLKNGAGTPPIPTSLGWLSVFHAVDAIESPAGPSLFYSAGIMINDRDRPHRLIYRSPKPLLVPETNAERFGTVDDVVFPTGIDEAGDGAFDIYYGAADAKISRARCELI
jgi:beta-1,2-mannobiose phosphorylase / 1,2-beta-oligomannan phosphorylase